MNMILIVLFVAMCTSCRIPIRDKAPTDQGKTKNTRSINSIETESTKQKLHRNRVDSLLSKLVTLSKLEEISECRVLITELYDSTTVQQIYAILTSTKSNPPVRQLMPMVFMIVINDLHKHRTKDLAPEVLHYIIQNITNEGEVDAMREATTVGLCAMGSVQFLLDDEGLNSRASDYTASEMQDYLNRWWKANEGRLAYDNDSSLFRIVE